MRALVLADFGRLEMTQRPDPRPGPGEVLLRVIATGICGSDLHGYTGENGRRRPGQVMGHEMVGTVEAVGAGVDGTPRPGARATVNPVIGCGSCAACAAGIPQRCADRRVIGVDPTLDASFAEYLVAPAGNVVPLPDTMPEEYGALVEPLAVGHHAAGRGSIGPGDTVLVLGGGPIGQAVLLAALRAGAERVVVSEPSPGRRALCARLGARSIDPAGGDVAGEVTAACGGPATVAVDAVGVSATLADALAATAPGARIVLVGMGSPRLDVAAFDISTQERSVIGTFSYPPAEFRAVADWVGTAPPQLAGLVERRVTMAEAPATFAELAADPTVAGKVLVYSAR